MRASIAGKKFRRLRGARARLRDVPPGWSLSVAPLAIAGLWAIVTGGALLLSSATGHHELLAWCRSGGGLVGAAALTLGATLAASVWEWRTAVLPRPEATAPVTTGTEAAGGDLRLVDGAFIS